MMICAIRRFCSRYKTLNFKQEFTSKSTKNNSTQKPFFTKPTPALIGIGLGGACLFGEHTRNGLYYGLNYPHEMIKKEQDVLGFVAGVTGAFMGFQLGRKTGGNRVSTAFQVPWMVFTGLLGSRLAWEFRNDIVELSLRVTKATSFAFHGLLLDVGLKNDEPAWLREGVPGLLLVKNEIMQENALEEENQTKTLEEKDLVDDYASLAKQDITIVLKALQAAPVICSVEDLKDMEKKVTQAEADLRKCLKRGGEGEGEAERASLQAKLVTLKNTHLLVCARVLIAARLDEKAWHSFYYWPILSLFYYTSSDGSNSRQKETILLKKEAKRTVKRKTGHHLGRFVQSLQLEARRELERLRQKQRKMPKNSQSYWVIDFRKKDLKDFARATLGEKLT